jgi:hypothetical protein
MSCLLETKVQRVMPRDFRIIEHELTVITALYVFG